MSFQDIQAGLPHPSRSLSVTSSPQDASSLFLQLLSRSSRQYSALLVHRFTLLKPGAKPKRNSGSGSPNGNVQVAAGWNPLDLFFASELLVNKCDVCAKRLGWKPVLDCDDCGVRCHGKCGEIVPKDCGIRPVSVRPGFFFLNAISPLSRVKQSASNASLAVKTK